MQTSVLKENGDSNENISVIASGTIPSTGLTVGLSTNSTVSVIAATEQTGGWGAQTNFNGAIIGHISTAYDHVNQKVVIAYSDKSGYGVAIVGTVSGNSISFGSPVIFNNTITELISTTYDPISQKIIIAYRNISNGGYGTVKVGTVSGDSISLGGPVVFNNTDTYSISTTYDTVNKKVVIAYYDQTNNHSAAIVGTVSGDSISFGDAVVFNSDNTQYISAAYDTINNKIIIAYSDIGNKNYGTAIVGTVSGTDILFGKPVVFNNALTYFVSAIYDPANNKVVIAYYNGTNGHSAAVVGTVSGTNISFSGALAFNSGIIYSMSAAYDSNNNKIVIVYVNNIGYGTTIVGTVSGDNISFSDAAIFNNAGTYFISPVYDSVNGKIVIAYHDEISDYGVAKVSTVLENSILFGNAAVFSSATASYISTVYDPINKKIIIAYYDEANSHGAAIVGTVSGNSISFGSPVIFNNTDTYYISAVYDSANQKVVIAYRNVKYYYYGASYDKTNGHGMAVVGTVSGDSISFGEAVVFNNSDTYSISTTYDSVNKKVVIAYYDGDNDHSAAKVGTVSGNSISFGDATIFNNAGACSISAVYDSANQKVVIAYRIVKNDNYSIAYSETNNHGDTIVGAISGDSILFGAPVVFSNTDTYSISAVYDFVSGKVVIAYRDIGNGDRGTAIVGIVSGNNISFGIPVVFNDIHTYNISTTYDTINKKVVIAYRNNCSHGAIKVGTVSDVNISFSAEIAFNSVITYYISAIHDSTNNKITIAYQDGTNNYGVAKVYSPYSF